MRISFIASLISDSVSLPLLRRCLKADEIFSVSPSNAMLSLLPELFEQCRHAGNDLVRLGTVQLCGVQFMQLLNLVLKFLCAPLGVAVSGHLA